MKLHTRRIGIAAVCAAVVAVPLSALPALAVLPTEASPHFITVFPQRDFVSLSGYTAQAGQTATFALVRNGVTIGTASGVLGSGDPSLEVNHPGGVCWDAPSTPDILPGDEVQLYLDGQAVGGGVGEGVLTRNVTVRQAVQVGTDVVVHGNATDLTTGGPIPLADFEQRIVNPDLRFTEVAKRDIRATDVSYDAVDAVTNPNGTNFTAAYHGLSQAARDAAVAGESRVLSWQFADPAGNRHGVTIYEAGVIGGPGIGGCPAAASDAVTSSTPKNLNLATNTGVLGLAGVSFDAVGVRVSLDDVDPATAPVLWPPADQPAVTPTPAAGRQTWSMSIPAAAHNTLSEGTLTATGVYTVPNGQTDPVTGAPLTTDIGGATLTLLKDLVAPEAPTASPPGGTYFGSQQVTLNPVDQADTVRYRIGATGAVPDPTVTSTVAPAQIGVTSSQTIKAAAFDSAGNRSVVLTSDYVISSATVPAAPTNVLAAPGDKQVTVSWAAPANGGSQILDYAVHVQTAGAPVGDTIVGSSPATITGLANGTQYSFTVSARNAVGSGPASTQVGPVTPVAPPVATVPAAPTGITATAGNASATVNWTAPASGGSPITSYTVQARVGTAIAKTVTNVAPSAVSSTVTGLTNGTGYTLRVRAINGVGAGPFSADSNQVTPAAAATAPGAPVMGAPTQGPVGGALTAVAHWTPPASTGGSAITGYQVTALRMSSTAAGATVLSRTSSPVLAASARQRSFTLAAGNYRFEVVAINAAGTSVPSARSANVVPR